MDDSARCSVKKSTSPGKVAQRQVQVRSLLARRGESHWQRMERSTRGYGVSVSASTGDRLCLRGSNPWLLISYTPPVYLVLEKETTRTSCTSSADGKKTI